MQDLPHIERQKSVIDRNTQHYLHKKPADNVLMTGARGTGKSSLVKAMLAAYGDQGLRLLEVDKADMGDLGVSCDQTGRDTGGERVSKYVEIVVVGVSVKKKK